MPGREAESRHRPLRARRKRSWLSLESLEDRLCLSTDFYNYSVIAKTGQTDQSGNELKGLSQDPSINDAGQVADVATYTDGQGIIVGDGTSSGLKNINPSTSHQSNRTFSPFVEINNNSEVVATDRLSGPPFLSTERIWLSDQTDVMIDVARAGLAGNPNYGPWDAIVDSSAINSHHDVVFPTLQGQFITLNLHHLIDPVNTVTTLPFVFHVPQALRPQISTNDRIVLRSGDAPTDPIVLYDANTGSEQTIASTSGASPYFDALGRTPGISSNGQIVVFAGTLNQAGANFLSSLVGVGKTVPTGKGIFASIGLSSGIRILWPIADSSQFSDINLDSAVAVNSTQDPTLGNPTGNQRAVTIAYIGVNATTGIQGIYTSRLNFLGNGTGAFDANNTDTFAVSTPTQVIQIGDTTISGLGAIQSLSIFNAVNNRDRGDIAFWASDGTKQAVVRARYQEPVYLDFNPQSSATLPYAQQMFKSLGAPAQWFGTMADVFAFYNRTDLTSVAATIQNDVVDAVQKAYDAIGAHIKFFGRTTDSLPRGGTYTRVLIGDGPNSSSNPLPEAQDLGDTYLDPFNGSVIRLNGQYQFTQRTPLIFIDNIFRKNGVWLDQNNNPIDLSNKGITQQDVENAVAEVIEHEVGHNFGLDHLGDPEFVDQNGNKPYATYVSYIMHDGTVPNELRATNAQTFGTTELHLNPGPPDKYGPDDTQNDQARLAFTVGDDIDPSELPREAPIFDVLKKLGRVNYKLAPSFIGGQPIMVKDAVLGLVQENGRDGLLPDLIDLGAGDLSSLLNTQIAVSPGDQIFLAASTSGNGIDIFSVTAGTSGGAGSVILPGMLNVLEDPRIRGDLFDASGQPASNAVDLIQMVNGQPVLIGHAGSASTAATTTVSVTPSSNSPIYGDSLTFTTVVTPTTPGSPTPIGTVQFAIDGVNLGSAVALDGSGKAISTSIDTLTAGSHTITAAYSGDTNYPANTGTVTISVGQAPLTVTADNQSMNHGDALPGFTYKISGFVLGENSKTAGVIGAPVLSTTGTSSSPAGYYPINVAAGSLAAANYTFTNLVSGILTIKPKVIDVRVDFGATSMSLIGLGRDLPFIDIKAIEVIFSDNVSVPSAMLQLLGVNIPNYSFSGFNYNSSNFDANWSLPSAIAADRLKLNLSGAAAPPNSGTGPNIGADPLNISFAVLPGDVNGDGVVSGTDAVAVNNQIHLGYVIWDDVTGAGVINLTDVTEVRKRIGLRLP
jgi:hypothetical protein